MVIIDEIFLQIFEGNDSTVTKRRVDARVFIIDFTIFDEVFDIAF